METQYEIDKRELLEFVETLPGEDGWWKEGNQQDYIDVAIVLFEDHQLPRDKVEWLLRKVYSAVADEYGD